jgi:hypothetical protein
VVTDKPNTPAGEAAFAAAIGRIYERHKPTMITVAKAAQEIRRKIGANAFAEVGG